MTNNEKEGSELPEFSDVKMFIDVLLMEYQTNRPIEYQLERNLMTCTPFRDDFLFSNIWKKKYKSQISYFFIFSNSIKSRWHTYDNG